MTGFGDEAEIRWTSKSSSQPIRRLKPVSGPGRPIAR